MKFLTLAMLTVMTVASSVSAEGGVQGKVSFLGTSPGPEKVRMDAVDYCVKQHPEGFSVSLVDVSRNGGLAHVFIYVKKGLEGQNFSAPREPKVVLDQHGCWYMPRILGIMVGQPLVVRNSDDVMHNVNAQPFFNIPTSGHDQTEKVFAKPRIMQRIRCNIHSWMSGYVGIVDNPYYAVTDSDGAFSMRLPPGKYTLATWHERLGELTQEVNVESTGTKVEFKYSAK